MGKFILFVYMSEFCFYVLTAIMGLYEGSEVGKRDDGEDEECLCIRLGRVI